MRLPNRHLAFALGEHFCIGASLARAEGAIALGRLLERVPHLEVVEPAAVWTRSPTLRVMSQLLVTVG
jgi:cytochrome P450